jgi:hypothetical protein
MTLRRSLYSRPVIVRGEQCAEARLERAWTVDRHQAAVWSLPCLPSRWQSCQRRADLGCQAANAGPPGGARHVLAGRLVVVAIEDVRTPSVPFVRSLSASIPIHHGVRGAVDGVRPHTTGQAVSESLSDRSVHPGRRTRPRGHRTGIRLMDVPASSTGAGGRVRSVPMLVAAGVGRRRACTLPSCLVRARMSRPRSWSWPAGQAHGRTLGA